MMKSLWVMLGCFAGTVTVAAEIPFPDALDKAAVAESGITDVAREALLVGNGDVRTLVWQHGATLSLRVVKNDVWDARVDTSQDSPMMRVDVANQKWSGGGYPPSWKKPYPHPRCAAVVRIGNDTSEPGAAELQIASARLDLRRAVAEVREPGDRRTTVRVLADRNVLLIESDRPVALEEIKSPDLPPAELGQTDGVPWLDMKMPGDPDYPGMEYALAVAHKGKCHAVAIATSFDIAGNVLEAAIRLAQETADTDLSELIARHEQAWQRYWSASGVELDDPDFELWWYRMVYLLGCISRPGSMPVGLFAALATDRTPWHGDYHHNYNAWQPYWTPCIVNHPELTDPWVRYMNDMLPRFRWLAKTTYDCEGACVGISSFAFEPDPAQCRSVNRRQIAIPPYGYTLGMAGMSAQVLWYRHLYQPDREYLEKAIYPVVRDVALFYSSFAEKCPRDEQGRVRFGPSYSPEHGKFGVANVPFDLAYARYTLVAASAAAEELGRDADLVERFRKAIDLLPPYPTSPDETGQPVVVDWTGCQLGQIRTHNITVPAVPVFPADQVTWFSSDAQKELFINTIRHTHHRGCNSTIMFSVAKARLSMLDALDDARQYYQPEVQPNGMFHWPMHGFYLSESVGMAAMISEFLLQSVDNTIRVFPCWPKTKDARFEDLRAQGGFLVSAQQRDGRITGLEITSTVGGPLRLLSPWPTISANGRTLHPDAQGLVEVPTMAGQRVTFTEH